MKFTKKFVALLFTALMLVTGCNNNNSSTSNNIPSNNSDPNSTDITDSLKLTRDYQGKTFTTDGIGVARFRSHTDGDTTNWWVGTEKIKFRYLGINTPESTSHIEPWGLSASEFTRDKTKNAKLIVLENDVDVFGRMDNNNVRYLGFVWYSMDGKPENLRCLNLELVELGYSLNQLAKDSTLCPYRELFAAAEKHARSLNLKIHGEKDPTFDYSNDVETISIYELRRNYQKYGKIESDNAEGLAPSSGKQLRIRALVVGMIGDNMVIRDLKRDKEQEEDDMFAGIYCYAGYNTSLAGSVSVGDVVFFYCRATKFNGTMQLSDLQTSFTDRKKPFINLGSIITNETLQQTYPEYDLNPYEMDTADTENFDASQRYAAFAPYEGKFVKTKVTVRMIQSGDYDEDGQIIEGTEFNNYFKEDASGNYTCYGNSQAKNGNNYLVLNLRVDGTQYPRINPDYFQPGHTYECYGYLSPYFEKYQLMLFNNTNPAYVVDLGVL